MLTLDELQKKYPALEGFSLEEIGEKMRYYFKYNPCVDSGFLEDLKEVVTELNKGDSTNAMHY